MTHVGGEEGKKNSFNIHSCVLNIDRYFERQMEAAEATKLPLFLHCRNSAQDFMEIISRNRDKIAGGVVSNQVTLF